CVEISRRPLSGRARQAIPKPALLHFAAAEPYARRILQMGEEPWRVHCVGAPGLDRLASLTTLSRGELAARLGLALRRPTLLVTFHPATLEHADTARQVDELAAALAA